MEKQMPQRLRPDIKEQIMTDVELQAKLAKASNKAIESIKRWVRTDDRQLLVYDMLIIIKNYNNEEDINQLCEPVEITA